MRVIAGIYKSRALKSVKSNKTRPTTDRNKENLFNMIGPFFDGGTVLDLFGGSGGLGIEAMSRGCTSLYSVDSQFEAYKVIKENVSMLKIENSHIYKMDYKKALQSFLKKGVQFDYIFLDPPYGNGYCDYVLPFLVDNNMLHDRATIVVEEAKEQAIINIEQLVCIKEVTYGITKLYIYTYQKDN